MLEVRQVSLQRGNKPLLEQVSFNVYPRAKIGLIGKNGTGKSSLFSLIRGELLPDAGDIFVPEHWKIASVRQETPSSDLSAIDYVLSADEELQFFQAALKDAEARNDGIAIAQAHEHLEQIHAYTASARAGKLLSGLGFSTEEQHNPVKTFSGGWRMRLNLAQALIQRADLLLLDEPTNHLDLETVLWLANYLNSIDTALLVISHDRDFLNAVTKQTLELAHKKITLYGGNYDFYEQEKAQRLAHQASAYAKQQTHIRHLQSFIDRFKAKATKAKQAQSRIKALSKLEKIAPAHMDSAFYFEFLPPENYPDTPIQLENAAIGYDAPLIENANLRLENGGRYGLLGVNGSGKTTLIKTLIASLPLLSGSLKHAQKLSIGYFAQHQLDALRPDWSPLEHLQHLSPHVKDADLRNFLGGFAFSGDKALEKTAPMSGGEKARLALALLIWQKPNVLLLDEPTNHLDLEMRHALTLALQGFQGALLVVSHDRHLLDTVCDQFLLIDQKKLIVFEGNLDEYQTHRISQNTSNQPAISSNRKEEKRKEAQLRQQISNQIKPLQKIIDHCERQIDSLTHKKNQAETFLANEEAYNDANKQQLNATLTELTEINRQLADLESQWLDAQEQIESIRKTILE